MEKEYAQAVALALEHGVDEKKLVQGLLTHLKASGRIKILPGLLRALKVDVARQEVFMPLVEAASEEEAKDAKKMAASVGIEVKNVTINPTLIRGWRARIGSSLVDVSGKKTLIDLYRSIAPN